MQRIKIFLTFPIIIFFLFFINDSSLFIRTLGYLLVPLISIIFISKNKQILNYSTSISIIFYLLLVFEILIQIKSIDNSFIGFNKKCAKFDEISGYKWYDEDIRFIKLINGELIYDNTYKPNNFGYSTKTNFNLKKDDNTIRYILFGDSFSSGIFLKTTMPDELQNNLNRKLKTNKYEIYSFSIDGGGLHNWHSIFFNEIVGNIDFDGLIFCTYTDNLNRKFFIHHSLDSGGFINGFENIPINQNEFQNKFLSKLNKAYEIAPSNLIDSIINRNNKISFQSVLFKKLKSFTYDFLNESENNFDKWIKKYSYLPLTYSDVKKNIGNKKIRRFEEIVHYCKKNKKQIILSSIPDKFLIRMDIRQSAQYEIISKHFDIKYFNGYEIFNQKSNADIEKFYLKNDGHWNQKGSDLFAKKFAEYIKSLK